MHGSRLDYLKALIAAFILSAADVASGQDNTVPSGLANPPAPPPPVAPAPPPVRTLSPVIWSENADIVQRFSVDGPAARDMLNAALLKLTSASDLGTAWTRLGITPDDIVGVKISTQGGPVMSSHRALVQAICDGLVAAGVPPSQIIVWDKVASDMRSAGYSPVPATNNHVGIMAVFPGSGYDPTVVYKNGVLGTLIWGDYEFAAPTQDDLFNDAREAVQQHGYGDDGTSYRPDTLGGTTVQTSNRSYYARLVTTMCTKIINVPVLTDNAYIGINGCLGSLAMASIDNNRRFEGDPTYGDPAICEILSNDIMRRKVVVNIMDALVAQYAGGPRFDPQFTRSIGAIYVSRDPVAVDAIVLQRLERWRASDRQGRIDPIGKTASHVHDATTYNLGTDDPARIQLIRVP